MAYECYLTGLVWKSKRDEQRETDKCIEFYTWLHFPFPPTEGLVLQYDETPPDTGWLRVTIESVYWNISKGHFRTEAAAAYVKDYPFDTLEEVSEWLRELGLYVDTSSVFKNDNPGRCPKCELRYGWDGTNCRHCAGENKGSGNPAPIKRDGGKRARRRRCQDCLELVDMDKRWACPDCEDEVVDTCWACHDNRCLRDDNDDMPEILPITDTPPCTACGRPTRSKCGLCRRCRDAAKPNPQERNDLPPAECDRMMDIDDDGEVVVE